MKSEDRSVTHENENFTRNSSDREKTLASEDSCPDQKSSRGDKIISWIFGGFYLVCGIIFVLLESKPHRNTTDDWYYNADKLFLGISISLFVLAILLPQIHRLIENVSNGTDAFLDKTKTWGGKKIEQCKTNLRDLPGWVTEKTRVKALAQKICTQVNRLTEADKTHDSNKVPNIHNANEPKTTCKKTVNLGILMVFFAGFAMETIFLTFTLYVAFLELSITETTSAELIQLFPLLICVVLSVMAVFLLSGTCKLAPSIIDYYGKDKIPGSVRTTIYYVVYALMILTVIAEIYAMNGRISYYNSMPLITEMGKEMGEDTRWILWGINGFAILAVICLGQIIIDMLPEIQPSSGKIKLGTGSLLKVFSKIFRLILIIIVGIALVMAVIFSLMLLLLTAAKALSFLGAPAIGILIFFAICWCGRLILNLLNGVIGILGRFLRNVGFAIFVRLYHWHFLVPWFNDDDEKNSGVKA